MNLLLLLSLFMLLLVITGIWQLVKILRTGIFPGRRRSPDIQRIETPGRFWVAIAAISSLPHFPFAL
ncbi:MAG: hypothetical protein HC799_02875 [Limnothrix sp. RL_2_0]|nr:hypothetical protein [Limnothrix sp. RL_2_0]